MQSNPVPWSNQKLAQNADAGSQARFIHEVVALVAEIEEETRRAREEKAREQSDSPGAGSTA